MDTTIILTAGPETLGSLQRRADHARLDLHTAASRLLQQACQQLPATGARVVVVDGEALEALEGILGGGSLLHGADLLLKVERLAGVSFLHQRLPFTPNQLEQLADKAQRQGLTVEQLVDRTAPRIYEQFFDLVARV